MFTKKNLTIGGAVLLAVIIIIILVAPESEEQKQEKLAEEKREATEEAEDLRKGFHCLSEVTGRHYGMEELIKDQLKDPGSFDEADTLIGPVENGEHTIRVDYRARNSLGGMVFGSAVGAVDTETCRARFIGFL